MGIRSLLMCRSLLMVVAVAGSLFLSTWILPVAADPTPQTENTTITLMHFNDLHAHLVPHSDLVPADTSASPATTTQIEERGGMARLATVVKMIRAENPNSILMNIGDTFHGGAEALFTNGNAIAAPVNALGIDIGVPGNWDFSYGPGVVRLRYTDEPLPPMMQSMMSDMMGDGEIYGPDYPNLAANLTQTLPPMARGDYLLPPTAILTVDGVQIGFIGITSDIVPDMYAPLSMGFEFVQGEGAYRDLINQHAADLRAQGVNLVVVMSELGIQKDYRLAQTIEAGAVDVFFSAHTHELTWEPLTSASGALVVEAGNDGYLGRMDVTLIDGRPSDYQWEVIVIDESIAPDPEMTAIVEAARAPFLADDVNLVLPIAEISHTLTLPLDTVIGHTDVPLDRRSSLGSGFNANYGELLRQTGQTAIAITPGFRFDAVISPDYLRENEAVLAGDITVADVYHFFPMAYPLATGTVDGATLKSIVETLLIRVYSPDVFLQAGGWVDGFAGLTLEVNLANPDGERVVSMALAATGEPIMDDTQLTVTGCQRPQDQADVMCSHSGFSDVALLINPMTGQPYTAPELLILALQDGYSFSIADASITDLNNTPTWPENPYVQPLSGVN